MHTPTKGRNMTPTTPHRSAYSLTEFCVEHRISRTTLWQLCKAGKGPRMMKLGRRVLVSVEAAAEWRRQVEVATRKADIAAELAA
jgi:predicted DNA-binding transcriptional regulator AlpA